MENIIERLREQLKDVDKSLLYKPYEVIREVRVPIVARQGKEKEELEFEDEDDIQVKIRKKRSTKWEMKSYDNEVISKDKEKLDMLYRKYIDIPKEKHKHVDIEYVKGLFNDLLTIESLPVMYDKEYWGLRYKLMNLIKRISWWNELKDG